MKIARVLIALVGATTPMAAAAEGAKDGSLSTFRSDLAKPYGIVRGDLLAHGYDPIVQTALPNPSDSIDFHLRLTYPESSGCAVDESACLFFWRAPDGRTVVVQTETDASRVRQVVSAIGYE